MPLSALAHPQSKGRNYQLVTDSSNAVSTALRHVVDGNPIPVRFFSKKANADTKQVFYF